MIPLGLSRLRHILTNGTHFTVDIWMCQGNRQADLAAKYATITRDSDFWSAHSRVLELCTTHVQHQYKLQKYFCAHMTHSRIMERILAQGQTHSQQDVHPPLTQVAQDIIEHRPFPFK